MTCQPMILTLVLTTAFAATSALQAQVAVEHTPQLRFAGESVQLEMPLVGGRSIINVRIDGRGPYKFFIDTGSSVSVVDTEIAKALDLNVVGDLAVGAPGGGTVDADRVTMPNIVAGGLVIEGSTALVLSLAEMTGGAMEGILGMDLFRGVQLTLDPSSARAVIARGGLSADGTGVIQADRSRGRMIFPIEVAGRSLLAHIDHGSPSGITLGIELLDSIPIVGELGGEIKVGMVGSSRTVRSGTLDGVVRFAGLEYENPGVGFMDPAPGTVNIGSRILNDLVITLDWENALIAFRRAERTGTVSSAAARQGPRRLGIQFRGMGGGGFSEIAMVVPGSLGEEAGFRVGDTLVSLNARPMSQYDQASLGALIGGAEPLRWEIERNGERIVIEIP